MQNGLPIAGIHQWISLVFRRFYGIRVDGDSMAPLLRAGDRVLVDPNASIEPGDVVLSRHPYRSSVRILKRLSSVEPDGRIFLTGDNPDESTDSRIFGAVAKSDLLGKVVARIK